jgi:signal transduction histidine kinase
VIHDSRSIFMLIVALAYFGIVGQVALKPQAAGSAGPLLMVYGAAGGIWAALDSARYFGWLESWPADVLTHLPIYAALSLSVILLPLTQVFLRTRNLALRWYFLGGLWLAAGLLLDGNILRLAPVIVKWPGWYIGRAALTQAALALGWGLYIAGVVLLTVRTYRRTRQPLHRNRQAYWSIAIALSVIAMAVILLRQEVIGHIILMGAGLVVMVAIVRHQLPDMRQTLRQSLELLVTIGLSIVLYAAVILAAPAAQRALPGLTITLVALFWASIVVVLINPSVGQLRRRLRSWASGADYDAQRMVGEYSLAVGGIVDLERLANVALGLIGDAIGVQHGALFVVDPPDSDASRAQYYRLRVAGALGSMPPVGALLIDSPIAAHFTREFSVLSQYELDLAQSFRDISTSERVWLQGMGMDVFVPIYASHQWIGLFALGPKISQHRYFDDDLRLLSTMADQTAVALQNARLVDDLVRLNAQMRETNSALDRANQQLAHLDRVKSDFIDVISHELRTPLSILYGYAQILLDEIDENGDDHRRQLIEGINTGTRRMQEIIDNMLDVTKIDSRALVLSAKPVSLALLVDQVLDKLRRPLAERNLEVETGTLANLPPVQADAAALTKVFHHLFVNAVKFTPDGGRITVTGRCLDDELPGGAVEIAIHDTGIGIDPRFLDLIFTKFYQMGDVALHSTSKTKFKGGGPGLGLAIARGIVEAHGGRLHAESSGYDEANLPGSSFVVLLPLSQFRDR